MLLCHNPCYPKPSSKARNRKTPSRKWRHKREKQSINRKIKPDANVYPKELLKAKCLSG